MIDNVAMPLTIPRRYQSGIALIRDLDLESFQGLLTAFRKVPSTISFASLSSAVAAMVDTIAVSEVEEVVPAALFLHSLKEGSDLSSPEIAERVALGMEEAAFKQLRSLPEHRDDFQARLLEVLNIADPLGVIAKAGTLSVEHEHSLTESRILTDIRPVFEQDDPQAPPTGAMIIHTLKIGYRTDNNELKEFFVALDADDVRELSEQIARANAKAESLKSVLKRADVRHIDAE